MTMLQPVPIQSSDFISSLNLHDPHVIRRKPEIEQERNIALGDLLRDNSFALRDINAGPYSVSISIAENRMIFDISSVGTPAHPLTNHILKLPVLPFRSIIRDYFMICESYFDAIATADPYKVEAIDMGRRGIHNEGSDLLQRLLDDKAIIDFDTARRLFTLMCVLHIR
jgi:uncharacterized protein (UPF0262 family)